LLKRTTISSAVIGMLPGVSTNFRNNLGGLDWANPFNRSAKPRSNRSATTVSVRSKSTFSRTALPKQSRWKNVICSPSRFST
jgi:hypothetical protein